MVGGPFDTQRIKLILARHDKIVIIATRDGKVEIEVPIEDGFHTTAPVKLFSFTAGVGIQNKSRLIINHSKNKRFVQEGAQPAAEFHRQRGPPSIIRLGYDAEDVSHLVHDEKQDGDLKQGLTEDVFPHDRIIDHASLLHADVAAETDSSQNGEEVVIHMSLLDEVNDLISSQDKANVGVRAEKMRIRKSRKQEAFELLQRCREAEVQTASIGE